MTALRAFAELNEQGSRINVHFKYSPDAVAAIKEVPGARFVPKDKGGPFWTIPLDMTSANRLREGFGQGLQLGDAVKVWGREEQRRQRNIRSLVTADDAELERLSAEQAAWLRPYQRADVALMATTSVLNANQPGVGKTVETIYAVQEAGLKGPHLIVAPITLHKDPWRDELAAHAPSATVFWGESPAERKAAVRAALAAVESGTEDVWLIVNPEMVRVQKLAPGAEDDGRPVLSRDHKGNAYAAKPEQGDLFKTKWGAVVADEFHKYGLGQDRNTLFARGLTALAANAQRRYALSGTPMGGKPIRLWGVLHFIEPELFSSKWRWAEQWLEIDDDGWGKKIGGLTPGREDEFWNAHAKHMVRRTRKEALPGLPDKVTIDVSVPMTAKQRKVYDEFQRAAEVAVEGGRMSATMVLAEYARLKQLANALCEVRDGEVHPTAESGKLPVLLDRLDTYGVRVDEPEPGARAIVASESSRFVALVTDWLAEQGLSARKLDGSVTGKDRNEVIDWYKEDSPDARVLVMTTQTGGVGLNLGMTGSIHILDETWNPDDQEQLEDRGMRNRTTQLNVLYYRSEDSIQQYIQEVAEGKLINNRNVVDIASRVRERARVERAER